MESDYNEIRRQYFARCALKKKGATVVIGFLDFLAHGMLIGGWGKNNQEYVVDSTDCGEAKNPQHVRGVRAWPVQTDGLMPELGDPVEIPPGIMVEIKGFWWPKA